MLQRDILSVLANSDLETAKIIKSKSYILGSDLKILTLVDPFHKWLLI